MGTMLIWTGATSKFLLMMTMSKFDARSVQRSKWTCSTASSSTTKKGVSISATRQCTVGWMSTISRCGTPWKPRSRYGMSNSKSTSYALATRSTRLQNSLNISLSFLRSVRSFCSSSSSSGSYIDRRPASSCTEASTTSVWNWTSCDFFLPIMMGCLRWKWMSTTTSCSHGWNSACLMFLYMMSRISCFFETNRSPFACASSVPTDFLPDMNGFIVRSVILGTRWSRVLMSVSCATRSASSAAFASDCRYRFRSSWIARNAALRCRCSRDRYSISLTKTERRLCSSTNRATDGGASLPSDWPGA
mmetsp:Transcript_15989/g.64505  ORF Transcript_15989/g.64505 Transcript_15989/m.64505 type:complete len:304 (-) Transcript_15989:761-1672(-)